MIPEQGTVSNFKRAVLAQTVDLDYVISLVAQHEKSTGLCSFAWHMRECSDTYEEIMRYGKEALPGILGYMHCKRRMGLGSGMSVMLLLMDIVQESPYEPEREGGFEKYVVADCEDAWLDWGYRNGYLDENLYPRLPRSVKKQPDYFDDREEPARPRKHWWDFLLFWR